jgi:hypothetical protein
MFLNGIHKQAYADAITTLVLCITSYSSSHDDGYLLINLCLTSQATQINLDAHACAHAFVPHVHCTTGWVKLAGNTFQSKIPPLWLDSMLANKIASLDRMVSVRQASLQELAKQILAMEKI